MQPGALQAQALVKPAAAGVDVGAAEEVGGAVQSGVLQAQAQAKPAAVAAGGINMVVAEEVAVLRKELHDVKARCVRGETVCARWREDVCMCMRVRRLKVVSTHLCKMCCLLFSSPRMGCWSHNNQLCMKESWVALLQCLLHTYKSA